ncbi:MAG TPA: nuclear transport factor 2 family protein [Alphaproteobacteria bacterium]|nr:nuclear transport factor 2 family protein [Alphaproteobacteria bacterium]
MFELLTAAVAKLSAVGLAFAGGIKSYGGTYAQDRAEIQDLQARYMFALDWQDEDAYAGTFAEDGVLDWAGGIVQGRDAIRAEVRGMRANFDKRAAAEAPARPSRLRHFITNTVIKVDGDTAVGKAYWFELDNDIRDRRPYVGSYGHYDDEMRKVNGQWLFSRRRINNEQIADRAAGPDNPGW